MDVEGQPTRRQVRLPRDSAACACRLQGPAPACGDPGWAVFGLQVTKSYQEFRAVYLKEIIWQMGVCLLLSGLLLTVPPFAAYFLGVNLNSMLLVSEDISKQLLRVQP